MQDAMQCVPCYREGLIAQKGQPIKFEPPFAFAVIGGESVCPKHLAAVPIVTIDVPDPLTPQEQVELFELRRKQRRWWR